MTYEQTIEYLYTALPMFSRMGSAAYKADLGNTLLLCEHLQHPENKFRSIHVAGTNGKGSVSHMLAAIFTKAGYKTGLYTSPHLFDFRERIRINGTTIEKEFVIDFVERTRLLAEQIRPSFFEITVAMAFDYFAARSVDIAIVEVGLGGRLDSTNVIIPEVSVITNISWDHMNLLGNTLPEIAAEKAGIIKPGVPVVIGERGAETETVFLKAAAALDAPIYFAEDRFVPEDFEFSANGITIQVLDKKLDQVLPFELDLGGLYQAKNLMTVLEVMQRYRTHISIGQVQEGLRTAAATTGLHGRWERISDRPQIVLDVAHNQDGLLQMLKHLAVLSYGKLHLIIGFVKDKDVEKSLTVLPKEAVYYFTAAHIPRALEGGKLQDLAAGFSLRGAVYENVNHALKQAVSAAGDEDIIVVCGSIFLVAEVQADQKFNLPNFSNA